jgi:hypothetical protein
MTTLHQQIAQKFLDKLAKAKELDAEMIEKLRTLFSSTRKTKADDFAKIFSPADDDLK